MTLQKLGKLLDKYENQPYGTQTQELSIPRNFPFYYFQDPTDTNTFNNAIGLPRKNNVEFPMFDYEQLLYDTLQKHKHIWIKKLLD
jgi:hypothetical protein